MLCVACGGEVPVGSRFCPRCGRATPTAEEVAGGAAPPAMPAAGPPTVPPAPPPPPPPPPPPSYGAPPGAYGAPPGTYGTAPSGYPPPPGGGYPGGYPAPPYGAGGGPVEYGLASFGQRVGGFLIDAVVQWAIVIVGFVIAAMTAPAESFDNPDPGPNALGGLMMFLCWVASMIYPIYFEGRPEGQTLGKKAVGIRVVRQANGAPLGYGLAIARFFARIVNWFTLGFGLLWAAWDPQRQAFHDKIVGTLVVRSSVYPPPTTTGSYQSPGPL
ncbi:MAG TPA: RDD family protein [Acidimicrobiia bacterium]|nr:RDD family protein [Acidimicrobiia bacterium]